MTTTLQRIGKAIRELRKSRNMTQEQLAELTDTAFSYIGSIERGGQNVTIETLEKIAHALHIGVFDLLALCQKENETIRKIDTLLHSQDDFHQRKILTILNEMVKKPDSR
ncbi:helix-turn-helix domain-containing protein [Paenibacillus sp. 1P07SE]|uniref:helix-turn-helix domain-containing protein n=1 Tax=Paenibacillus sp. 1P07SE TaxID=3132209 RepID=UPI0039A402CB